MRMYLRIFDKEVRDGDVHCAEEGEVSKKFASRECGTDKHGNVYTEEFLSKQIK